jgi:hypothetical protein
MPTNPIAIISQRNLRPFRIDDVPKFASVIGNFDLVAIEGIELISQCVVETMYIACGVEDFPWLDARNPLTRLEDHEKGVKTVDNLNTWVAHDREFVVFFSVDIDATCWVDVVELVGVDL